MFVSTTIAIVIDNVDPSKMHRIKVKFTTDTLGGRNSHSSWCRMLTPMAGMNRGLTMLPEIGTEVLVGFAYRSATPYILGAVYNGVDLPEPYRNDDCLNNMRVFWSRNDHMVVFDDTEGAESVGLGAQAPDRLDVTSAGLHGVLDSSERVLTHRSDGDTIVEAEQTISIRCANFRLEAGSSVDIESGNSTTAAAGGNAVLDGGAEASFSASAVQLNPSSPAAVPASSKPMPSHNHPPVFGTGLGLNALSGLPEGSQGTDGEEVAPGDPARPDTTDLPDGVPSGDAWDSLRDKTKGTVGSRVDDAVSDLIGGRVGDALGDAAADFAKKGVDAAFDAVEGAISDAFTGGGMDASGERPDTTRRSAGTGSRPATSKDSASAGGPEGGPARTMKPPGDADPSLPGGPGPSTGDSSSTGTLEAERAPVDAPDPGRPSTLTPGSSSADDVASRPIPESAEPVVMDPSIGAPTGSPESPGDAGPDAPRGVSVEPSFSGPASEVGSDEAAPVAAASADDGASGIPDATDADPETREPEESEGIEPGIADSVADPTRGSTATDRPGIDAKPERNPDGDRGVRDRPVGPDSEAEAGAGTRGPRGPRTSGGSSGGASIDIPDIIDDLTPDES